MGVDVIGPSLLQQHARGGSTEPRQGLRAKPGIGRKRRASLRFDAVQDLHHLAEASLGLLGPDPGSMREGVTPQAKCAGDLCLRGAQYRGDERGREELVLNEFLETHVGTWAEAGVLGG